MEISESAREQLADAIRWLLDEWLLGNPAAAISAEKTADGTSISWAELFAQLGVRALDCRFLMQTTRRIEVPITPEIADALSRAGVDPETVTLWLKAPA